MNLSKWTERLTPEQQSTIITELMKLKIEAETEYHQQMHESVKNIMRGRVLALSQVIELIESWNLPKHGK
jgi:hypothetical protein